MLDNRDREKIKWLKEQNPNWTMVTFDGHIYLVNTREWEKWKTEDKETRTKFWVEFDKNKACLDVGVSIRDIKNV